MSEQNPVSEQKKPAFGVLIVNLGTPAQPTAAAVRRYLRQFLSDRRVIDTPRWIWWPILNAIILTLRPPKVAKLYRSVWTDRGSPLLLYSRRQQAALEEKIQRAGYHAPVQLAMTYGEPSVSRGLKQLESAGCERILVLPLYPQYSATTVAAVNDAVFAALKRQPNVPELRFIRSFHQQDSYLNALAGSVQRYWQSHGRGQRLLMSFHGIPKRYAEAGDPYIEHCLATANALARRLALPREQWQCAFQSRFGPAEWVKPYTDETLVAWGREALSRVDVICPAFTADCLETLEETKIQNMEIFKQAGGGEYHYIPALNDNPDFIDSLFKLVEQHTQGW